MSHSHYKFGSVCAVLGCSNYKKQAEEKSFFRMPKKIDLLELWIQACKRPDLPALLKTKPPDYFYNTFVVCSDHFEISCFRNKNLFSQGLTPGSVPTLKLYKEINSIKRESPQIVSEEPMHKRIKTELEHTDDKHSIFLAIDARFHENSDVGICSVKSEVCEASSGTQCSELPNAEDLFVKLNTEVTELKSCIEKYRCQLKNKDSLLCKFRKKNKILKEKIKELQQARKQS